MQFRHTVMSETKATSAVVSTTTIGRTDSNRGHIIIKSALAGVSDNSFIQFQADGGSTIYTRKEANSCRLGKGHLHHISGSVASGFFVKKGASLTDDV